MRKFTIISMGLIILFISLAFNVLNVSAFGGPPFYASIDCVVDKGGKWDNINHTCRAAILVSFCPSGVADYIPLFYNSADDTYFGVWKHKCVAVNNSEWFILNKYVENTFRNDLILKSPGNVYIHYAEATCTYGCLLSTQLYKGATQRLDDGYLGIARVKINGNPTINSYRICFITSNTNSVQIYNYKYYDRVWIPIPTTFYDGHACAYSGGSNQFALYKD